VTTFSAGPAPTFSIITVVRNGAGTVGDALRSLYAQSFEDFEHVIQDGCSTDGTAELLEAVADPRKRMISERDGGVYDALNRATARCRGAIIGLLHSDDFFAKDDVLEKVARRFAETGADAVYGDLDYVSAADSECVVRHWRSGEYHPRILARGWMPPHPALFLRRSVIERHGNYDTSFKIAADYDAVLRYFGSGDLTVSYLPEVLVKMRIGGLSNRSLANILLKSREDYRALRSNSVGGIGALFYKNARKLPQFFG
jgi:glycosyltransferase